MAAPTYGILIAFVLLACGAEAVSNGDAGDLPVGDALVSTSTVFEWESRAPLSGGGRQETAVVAFRSQVFVLGGIDGSGATVATVEAYDPVTDRWRAVAPLPVPLHHANAAVAQDRLFVLGYLVANFGEAERCFEYDAENDRWTDRTSIARTRARGSSVTVALGRRIYLFGGFRAGRAVRDVDVYDVEDDRWEPLVDLPFASDHGGGSALADGTILLVGGRAGGLTEHSDRLWSFDVSSGFMERASMPTSRAGIAVASDGVRLFVFGGEGNAAHSDGVFSEAEVYDAVTGIWTRLPDMPTPRHGTGAAFIAGKVHVPGGATIAGFGAVDAHEALRMPR